MSGTVLQIRRPRHASLRSTLAGAVDAMGTSACALIHEWRRRYRSRLELASYSYDQRKDFGFAADVDGEIAKPFWKQ